MSASCIARDAHCGATVSRGREDAGFPPRACKWRHAMGIWGVWRAKPPIVSSMQMAACNGDLGGLGGFAPHRKKAEGKCRKTLRVLSAFFLTGVEREAFNWSYFERSASAQQQSALYGRGGSRPLRAFHGRDSWLTCLRPQRRSKNRSSWL